MTEGLQSAFSTQVPNLQLAWDSTSLGVLKSCPRRYQYEILEGWTPKRRSDDLTFGLIYHGALERYDHKKADGLDHETALLEAFSWAADQSILWITDHKYKNPLNLLRTIVWYLDQFKDDPVQTVRLGNGRPAIELSFRFEVGVKLAISGEPVLLCGHMDKIGEMGGKHYVVDRKTTKSTLSDDYFAQYSPDNQMSLYALAAQIVFGFEVDGLIVDAAQVAIGFSRFQRGWVRRTQEQLDEWFKDFHYWTIRATQFAVEDYWPQNDKACFRCPFRDVCARPPSVRAEWLKAEFDKRPRWDPLKVRGDI